MGRSALVVTVLTLVMSSSASTPAMAGYGFCMEPRAPSAMFLTKPTKPVCYSGCSEWQITAYKRDAESYFEHLKQYADDVDRYYKKAGEYVECMADLN